jgi:hypothetical protein
VKSEQWLSYTRLKAGIAAGLAAVLVGLPSSAQAEEILDLESLVAYLELNSTETINLRALTPLNQIDSNPEKPDDAKGVSTTFTGSLDGGGIKIVLAGSRLFSQLSNAKIENLQISGEIISPYSSNVGALAGSSTASEIVNVTAENVVVQANDESGILVGYSQDTVYEDVTVKNSDISGNSRIGGVVGNSLRDSFETVLVKNVSVEGTGDNIAGIAGYSVSSAVTRSQVESSTISAGDDFAGGIVGYLDSTTVFNVIVRSVQVEGESNVGGIAGFATSNSTIANSIVQGLIEGNSKVGGIAGESNVSLANLIVKAEVTGINEVGGLVGLQAGSHAQVIGTSFIGKVSGTNSVGGLAGESSSLIHDSISIAEVQGETGVGGLVGKWWNPDTSTAASHVYSQGKVSGNSKVGGLVGELLSSDSVTCRTGSWFSDFFVCISYWRDVNYLNLEDVRTSVAVEGNSATGSLVGRVAGLNDSPYELRNPVGQFQIKYPNDLATTVRIGGSLLSEGDPNFRIGENQSRYLFEDYSEASTLSLNSSRAASALTKSQSSVFINSDVTASGVEVFSSWTSLAASETGAWGQCTPGSLPYLRAIVKVNPCPNQPSSQSTGSQGSGSASLRANVFALQSRDSSSRVTESLAKMITSGGKIDVLSLRDSGFENLTLKVQSELNSLTGGSDADLVKKQLESILVNASFFDLSFRPSSKTFEFFGIRGVSEKLIPKILDLVRNSPDSSIGGLERIENVTNRVLILDLISGSDQRPRLSSELVIKAGLVDSKSPHIKLVARTISRLSPSQVDTVEKLMKAVTEIKVKTETRMSKLQQRKLAFAA